MKLTRVIQQSFKAMLGNKGRSFLTILGIIIGIGSVIALISLGQGVQASVSKQVATLGAENLTVLPGQGFAAASQSGAKPGGGGAGRSGLNQASTLTAADLELLQNHTKNPHVKSVSGNVSSSAIFTVGGVDQRMQIMGTSATYFDINSLGIDKGSAFTNADVLAGRHVMVVGHKFATDVLGAVDAVGKTVTMSGQSYKVVAVLKAANETGFSDPNSQAYVPYTAAMTTFGVQGFSNFLVQATNKTEVDTAKTEIQKTLLAAHKISNAKLADFNVNTSKDLLSAIAQITGLLTSLLAGIAAISLIVGGIGIMNIMLVSVTERTREIGLRKAVGAKTADILGQFITEAMLLTLVGGLLGIGLGKVIGLVAAKFLDITPVITLESVLLAVGVSSAVGLVFGIYPAAKAARLNPIDALRYE